MTEYGAPITTSFTYCEKRHNYVTVNVNQFSSENSIKIQYDGDFCHEVRRSSKFYSDFSQDGRTWCSVFLHRTKFCPKQAKQPQNDFFFHQSIFMKLHMGAFFGTLNTFSLYRKLKSSAIHFHFVNNFHFSDGVARATEMNRNRCYGSFWSVCVKTSNTINHVQQKIWGIQNRYSVKLYSLQSAHLVPKIFSKSAYCVIIITFIENRGVVNYLACKHTQYSLVNVHDWIIGTFVVINYGIGMQANN